VRKRRLWLLAVWAYARLLECGQAISKAPGKARGWAGSNYALTICARRPRHCSLPPCFIHLHDSLWQFNRDRICLRHASSLWASEARPALRMPCTRVMCFPFRAAIRAPISIVYIASSFCRTTCRLPAASRTTVLFPPHSVFA